MGDQDDLEAPDTDVFEQSVPVGDPVGGATGDLDESSEVEAIPDDPEIPERDARDQHQPAPVGDDDWR